MAFIFAIFSAVFNFIINELRVLWKGAYLVIWGQYNLIRMIVIGIWVPLSGKNYGDVLSRPKNMRSGMAILRAFLPTLVIKKKLTTAYENTGTAFVMADDDVREIVYLDQIFRTAYEPKMNMLTDGGNFFLAMDNTPDYVNNVSSMHLAVNQNDISGRLTPFVKAETQQIVDRLNGKIDFTAEYMLPVMARLVGDYFGTPAPNEQTLIRWTHDMFRYIFFDFSNDQAVIDPAQKSAEECRAYIDQLIAVRKNQFIDEDDVLGRCLKLQAADTPAMDDLGIRNNILGMITAMLPTIPNAAARILDQLLDRPRVLAKARKAAQNDDDALLLRYLVEAFRFNPMNPVLFRIANQDHILAEGTLRQRKIPKGTFVFAANFSAMFDPMTISSPGKFDIKRPQNDYILWGLGLHTCFGEQVSRALLPHFLKPLLVRKNLRRAEGDAGQIDFAGTPFPKHFHIQFD